MPARPRGSLSGSLHHGADALALARPPRRRTCAAAVSTCWPSRPVRRATSTARTASSCRRRPLYPDEKHRMSEATLEAYIRQLLEAHRTPEVTVAWQGGEPTLMGVDFFAVRSSSSTGTGVPARRSSTRSRPTASRSTTSGAHSSRPTTSSSASPSTARVTSTTPTASPAAARDLRPGDEGLGVPAQARRRFQHPVHGQRRQPGARAARLRVLPRRAPRVVDSVHPDRRARHGRGRSSSPTAAGASGRARKRLLYMQAGTLVTGTLGRAAGNTGSS